MVINTFLSELRNRRHRIERTEVDREQGETASRECTSGEPGTAFQLLAGEDLIIQEISIDGICGVY